MAKIPSPIGPTIDIAARTVSRSVIAGGGSGGGGGNVQPQTSAVVKRNTTDIVQLRKDHNALVKAQSASVSVFRNTIGNLSDQFKVINVSVRDLGGGVTSLNRGITTDTNLEVTKDRQELDREKRLAERGEREGKERQLEQKLQQALLAPVQAITKRAQGILGSLMNAFTLFFLGWLSNKVIQILKDQSGKTTNIFKALFDGLISGVTTFFKSLQFINKSLRVVASIVFGITKLISKFITGTLGLLFKGLSSIGKGIANAGKGIFSGAKNLLGFGDNAAKIAGKEGLEATGKLVAKEGAEAAGKGIFKKIPGLSIGAGLLFGGARAYQGDYLGAAGELASGIAGTFAGPGTAISLGIDAWLLGRDINKGFSKDKKNPPQSGFSTPQTEPLPTKTTPSISPEAPAAMPSTPLTPTPMQFGVDQTGMTMNLDYGESSTPPKTETAETSSADKQQINLAQTQSIPSEPARVGPAPTPKPNIIPMSSISPKNNQSSTVLRSSPGSVASDVPFIPSSNPDNFYTMYSQINYNVVI